MAVGLQAVGQELTDIRYRGLIILACNSSTGQTEQGLCSQTLDWLVKLNDPVALWQAQPTYILSQVVVLLGGVATLSHALKNGNRLPYLWLATIFHGLVVEIITYNLDDVDNFWHSQTPIIFLGRRLPLHIIILYAVFIYHASVAVSRMRLPNWAEPFAVGLLVVLIDIPFDIVSVKFLHWTWHDTDPNIADRHYWVPWNSFYFHSTFAASFTFWFHSLHRWMGGKQKWSPSSTCKELTCMLLTAGLGMPGGVLLFLPLYHPLHDIWHIHSEVTFMILFSTFLLVVWIADRKEKYREIMPVPDVQEKGTVLMILHLIMYYLLLLGMVLSGRPEDEISVGLHEPTGPCNETVSLNTAFGTVLQKRRYLCTSDYNEDYFSFICMSIKKPPGDGKRWYTICGTPFENRAEYIAVTGTLCILALVVFSNLYFCNRKPEKSKKA